MQGENERLLNEESSDRPLYEVAKRARSKNKDQAVMPSAQFYVKNSYRDSVRNKCNFCLALCSVFVVVFSLLVIESVIEKGPIVFLEVSENTSGQQDAIITPSQMWLDLKEPFIGYNSARSYLNYTSIMDEYPKKYNFAPRIYVDSFDFGITEVANKTNFMTYAKIYYIDTEREKEIGLGEGYTLPAMKANECVIHNGISADLRVNEGDEVMLWVDTFFNPMISVALTYNQWAKENKKQEFGTNDRLRQDILKIPCKVKAVQGSVYKKVPQGGSENAVFVEIGALGQTLANAENFYELLKKNKDFMEWFSEPKSDFNSKGGMRQMVNQIVMTLPSPRYEYYQYSDFTDIQNAVTIFGSQMVEDLGFFPIKVQYPILEDMEAFSLAVLFMGLIFDMIIVLFVIIAILLIYSLLMVSVETKTFQVGVIRMVGMRKDNIISMIFIQSLMFVLPSIVLGMIFAFPSLWAIYKYGFEQTEKNGFYPVPSFLAFLQAFGVGIFIPLLSSIMPIRSAMKMGLGESLDYTRSKTKAVDVQILDPSKRNVSSLIIFGVLAVVYGVSVYVLLPLSLLSFNFGLLLSIFFVILLSLILGLTLVAINFQRILETLIVYTLLIWEKASMKSLILKNLTAHKERNKMTALIYSLSIGFLIYLVVSYGIEVQILTAKKEKDEGSPLTVNFRHSYTPQKYEELLFNNSHRIKHWSYGTQKKEKFKDHKIKKMKAQNYGRLNDDKINIWGVSPDHYKATYDTYWEIAKNGMSGLSVTEQLYTPRGMQGVGLGKYFTDQTQTDPHSLKEQFLLDAELKDGNFVYFRTRPLWTVSAAPHYLMTEMPKLSRTQDALASIPYIFANEQKSIQSFMRRIQIMPETDEDQNYLAKEITKNMPIHKVYNSLDGKDDMSKINGILDIVFGVVIGLTMFLCFFSLTSSMTSNLFEQTKEIAVLRSIGYTKGRIRMLYIYEAFILVSASCLLGVIIGSIVSFTMSAQQSLFVGIPLKFFFPWQEFLLILGLSFICALLATLGPSAQITNKQISQILKMI